MDHNISKATFHPDYDTRCVACGATPTVQVMAADGQKRRTIHQLCGPCTWGDSEMHDPDNWE